MARQLSQFRARESNDEWMISRRYMPLEVLEKAQHISIDEIEEEENL